jgi:hypothetical protein
MNECRWCNQKYEKPNPKMDNGFCSAQCRYDWEKKAESMGLRKRPADLPRLIDEEEEKKRCSQAITELINFVKLMSKRHGLTPMQIIGVWKMTEDILLSGGTNIELIAFLRDLQRKGVLPEKLIELPDDDKKVGGYQ